jgi:hypothetical protein
MSNKESSRAEVPHGTLDVMVLRTVAALGPQHGCATGVAGKKARDQMVSVRHRLFEDPA